MWRMKGQRDEEGAEKKREVKSERRGWEMEEIWRGESEEETWQRLGSLQRKAGD